MPSQLLTTTQAVDPVFKFIFGACLVMLVGIAAATIIFAIRYRRSRCPHPTSQVDGSLWLEALWTGLPTLLVMGMFYYGWVGYLTLRNVPAGALPVTAVARMWSWNFQYGNGKTSSKLYVPVGRAVKVALVSRDVIHGFYLPAFRVKRDVVPGMENYAWFVAPKAGSYDLFCSQYCGMNHSAMVTTVEALPEDKFEAWLNKKESAGGGVAASAVFEKYGCLSCHSLDGTKKVGPTFKGIWGRSVTVHTAGTERALTADEGYIRRSLKEPSADLVDGYPPVMPSFASMSEEEVRTVLDYFKGRGKEIPKLDGAQIAKAKGCLGCHTLDGSRGVGPSFKGIFGTLVKVKRDGKMMTVKVDEPYLRESILVPKAALVDGFPPVMPDYDELSEGEVTALVQYLETLK